MDDAFRELVETLAELGPVNASQLPPLTHHDLGVILAHYPPLLSELLADEAMADEVAVILCSEPPQDYPSDAAHDPKDYRRAVFGGFVLKMLAEDARDFLWPCVWEAIKERDEQGADDKAAHERQVAANFEAERNQKLCDEYDDGPTVNAAEVAARYRTEP